MSEPNRLDIGDWFSAGVAVLVALLGVAFPRLAKRFRDRRDAVDAALKAHDTALTEQAKKLAVLENEKINIEEQLNDIKHNTRQTNEKLDQLILNLMK